MTKMVKQSEPLKVETWAVEKVVPYIRNPRKNEGIPVAKVKASLKEFGWRQPIVVDSEGVIIVGHTRYQAALELGMTEIPVHVAEGLTAAQVKAYRIADNKTGDFAEWDFDLLKLEFADLQDLDFGLDLTGFDDEAIDGIMVDSTPEGLTDPDEVPDVPDEPVSKPGDVWVMGNHRLMCGDSTSIDAVDALMAGKKADMVFTSPPYNADTKAGQGDIFNKKKSVKLYADGYKDALPSSEYVSFASSILEICFSVADGFIFWNVSYNAKSRFEYIQQIIGRLPYLVEQVCWKKSSTIPFKGSLMRDWEPIYIFSTNKQPVAVKEVTSNFWQISNTGAQAENHKACFPVELPTRAISIVANNTGIIFEPFSGSGTTIVAAEMTGRCCYAMELNPAYVDVAVKRWEDFTGKKAVLEESNAEG